MIARLSEAETIARNRAELRQEAAVLGVSEVIDLEYQTDDPYAMHGEDNQDHKLVAEATDEAFWTSQFDLHHPEHSCGRTGSARVLRSPA